MAALAEAVGRHLPDMLIQEDLRILEGKPFKNDHVGAEILTSSQCKQARQLLNVSQAKLATQAGLFQAHLSLFERTGRMPMPRRGEPTRLADLRKVLENAGAEFFADTDGATGVRLRETKRKS